MNSAQKREDGMAQLMALAIVTLLVVASIASVSVKPTKDTYTSQVLSDDVENEVENEGQDANERAAQETTVNKTPEPSEAEKALKEQMTEEEKLQKKRELEKKKRELEMQKAKLRVETKEHAQQIKLNQDGVRVKMQMERGELKLTASEEGKKERELEDDSLKEVQKGFKLMDVEVATKSGERFVLRRGNGSAVTGLPISLELSTNTLIVTTPKGEKRVAVLPDAAIQNLIRDRLIDEVQDGNATDSGKVELKEDGDRVVYEVSGLQRKRFLGFWTVKLERKVKVSAETGEVVSSELSTLDKLKELLSN